MNRTTIVVVFGREFDRRDKETVQRISQRSFVDRPTPLLPANALKHDLMRPTDALDYECCNQCKAIVGGEGIMQAPPDDCEIVSGDGADHECFDTPGGPGMPAETPEGKARRVSGRTIRCPGHRETVKLLKDLGPERRRDPMRDIFATALPRTDRDVVPIFCTARGIRDGRPVERSFLDKSRACRIVRRTWSAIQIITAAGVCGVPDLPRCGALPSRGFVRHEDVPLAAFLATASGALHQAGTVTPLQSAQAA